MACRVGAGAALRCAADPGPDRVGRARGAGVRGRRLGALTAAAVPLPHSSASPPGPRSSSTYPVGRTGPDSAGRRRAWTAPAARTPAGTGTTPPAALHRRTAGSGNGDPSTPRGACGLTWPIRTSPPTCAGASPDLRRPTSRLVSATPPPVADPRRPVGQPRLATDAGSSFPTPARRSCTPATRSGHGRLSGDRSSALSPALHQPRSQSFVPHASRAARGGPLTADTVE